MPDQSRLYALDVNEIGQMFKSIMDESRVQQQSLVDGLQRPKVELMHFDGDPLKYWPFMRSFENAVDTKTEDCSRKTTYNQRTLYHYCSPGVREVMQCSLVKPPKQGYAFAITLLQERYGNNDVIAQ